MTDQPITPEVQELRDEQAAERAYVADSRANAVQAQAAQTKVLLAQATLRNSIAWFITMAWIVGGIVVVSEVIL